MRRQRYPCGEELVAEIISGAAYLALGIFLLVHGARLLARAKRHVTSANPARVGARDPASALDDMSKRGLTIAHE
jgi:hypothetical protein